jgi:hypothetical protein
VAEATAGGALVVTSPDSSPEEGLEGDTVDTAMVMAGLALDLVSPMPLGPTALTITHTRRATLLTLTLTPATRLHTIGVRG